MPVFSLRFALCACLASDVAVFAQRPVSVPPAPSVHQQEGKVVIDVVVRAKSGDPVAGLEQGDFLLTDNNAAKPITSFRALTPEQSPQTMLLVVDAVNIGYDRVSYARQEIEKFLKSNGGKLPVPTALAIFTDTGTQIQPGYSTDGNALRDQLDKFTIGLREIRRSAGFYGAEDRLDLSLKAMNGILALERGRPGRKLVVWISPGWPLLSGPQVDLDRKQQNGIFANIVGLSTGLREAGVTLYNVNPLGPGEDLLRATYYREFLKGVDQPGKVDIGDLALQVLSVQSGGLSLNSSNDVASMLKTCAADAEAYYEITFDTAPAEEPNEYHHIEVKVEKPGLVARTRDGYYAQP